MVPFGAYWDLIQKCRFRKQAFHFVCVDPLPLPPNRRLEIPGARGGSLPLASNRMLEVPKAVVPFCARGGPLSLAPNRRLEVAQAVGVLCSGRQRNIHSHRINP